MMKHCLALRNPTWTVRWYGYGEHCLDAQAGDVFLVDHGTSLGFFIKIGQWIISRTSQRWLKGYTWLDHVAAITVGGPGAVVSEMGPRGYRDRELKEYIYHLYAVAHPNYSESEVAGVLANNDSCRGVPYGWIEYPALAINGLTGAKLDVSWGSSMICSFHTTMCQMGSGRFFPDKPPGSVMPTHWALWVGAKFPRS
jgi:hypothetical protein